MTSHHNGAVKARCFGVVCAFTVAAVLWAAPISSARAADMIQLYDWVADLVQNSKRINAAVADIEQAKENVDVADGDWYPTLDATASYGYEDRQAGEGRTDTVLHPRVLDLSLTQKLWDFGAIDASTETAALQLSNVQSTGEATRQSVIMEGVQSYLNLIRQYKLLRFSRASVENLKRQYELEDARVERGSGFSTDVLQAKRQLAGAEARRVRTEGALKISTNQFLSVFGSLPSDIDMMMEPQPPADLLPPTMEDAVDAAMKENPELHSAAMRAELARANVDGERASNFFPDINLVADYGSNTDVAGTRGNTTTSGVKVEMTYSWNLSATAIDSLRAAKQGQSSTEFLYADVRDDIEERVRTAWDRLETARENAQFLTNQANIASEFLELARRERTLGNRSLIDVLAGETELINATSDALSAELDASVAVFQLLTAMGRMDLDSIPKSDRAASLGN